MRMDSNPDPVPIEHTYPKRAIYIDSIYYGPVYDSLKENFLNGNIIDAYLIFNAYTDKPGRY
jgi:hypothetical protein